MGLDKTDVGRKANKIDWAAITAAAAKADLPEPEPEARREDPRPARPKAKPRPSGAPGTCLYCGERVPKPKRGPRGRFCSGSKCRVYWHRDQERQRRGGHK